MKWFSLSGIAEETKRVRWPKKEDLFKDFGIVIVFSLLFGSAFVFFDLIVTFLLRFAGFGA